MSSGKARLPLLLLQDLHAGTIFRKVWLPPLERAMSYEPLKRGDRIQLLSPLLGGWQGCGIVEHVEGNGNFADNLIRFTREDTPPSRISSCYTLRSTVRKIAQPGTPHAQEGNHRKPSPAFTTKALRAMKRTQHLKAAIQTLVEVERDLEWIWFEEKTNDLCCAVETALVAVRTTTQTFRKALGEAERA